LAPPLPCWWRCAGDAPVTSTVAGNGTSDSARSQQRPLCSLHVFSYVKGDAMRKTARAFWSRWALVGLALVLGLLVEGCPPPATRTGSPAMRVIQGTTSLANGGEYVFSQGVIADGDGGICSDDVVFTIQNAGDRGLIINGVQLTSGNMADFDMTAAATPVTVAPAASTTFTVCLDPVVARSQTSAVAAISSDDTTAGTFTLSLRGFGMKGRLVAPDGGGLGSAVAISGDTAVIGAIAANAAYIFYRNQGGTDAWGFVKKLTGSGSFGSSVAVSGDTIVVGSPDAGNQEGGVTVFYRNFGGTDNWGEVKYCVANDMDGWDNCFGSTLALSGDVLVVGARRDTTGSMGYHGSAYVCYRNQGTSDNWGIVRKLLASDRSYNDYFGTSLSLSGDSLAVGAPGHATTGAAYIFDRHNGGADYWGQSREITGSDSVPSDQFGRSVSMDVDTLVVGAPYADAWRGRVYVYYRNLGGTGTWGEAARLPNSRGSGGDAMGIAAAVCGDAILVGAPSAVNPSWAGGSIITFSRNLGGTDAWGQSRRLAVAGATASAAFGSSLAASGTLFVVGAPYDAGGGSAHVCEP
jgi:hypothetical protein